MGIKKLNYMKFTDIKFNQHDNRKWARVNLDNGLEISIVRNEASYGNQDGRYEMGVFKNGRLFEIEKWQDCVKGWLSPSCVEKELEHLMQLED